MDPRRWPSPCHFSPVRKTKLPLDCALLYVVLDSICAGFPHTSPNWFPDRDLVVQHFPFPPPVSCPYFWSSGFFFFSHESHSSNVIVRPTIRRTHPWSPEILFGKVHFTGPYSVIVIWNYCTMKKMSFVIWFFCSTFWNGNFFFSNPDINIAFPECFQLLLVWTWLLILVQPSLLLSVPVLYTFRTSPVKYNTITLFKNLKKNFNTITLNSTCFIWTSLFCIQTFFFF